MSQLKAYSFQISIPLWQGQPTAVAFPHDPAAVHSQSRSGGEENQSRPKGHWPGQQSRKYLQAYCQLLTNILYVDYMDDFGIGLGIRFYAFPWKPSPRTDSFLHLPLRQPGQGFCNCAVQLHYHDRHGRDPGSQQNVVQPENHLAAPEWNWHRHSHWISCTMFYAYGFGVVDGVSLPCRKKKRGTL